MLSVQITSMKIFMQQLLTGSTFDSFLLEEALIQTAYTYTIDGRLHRDFYPAEERATDVHPYDFQPWSEARGLCFQLLKGKYTPLHLKFVLHWKPEAQAALLSGASPVKALVLTIRYDGNNAVLTTGVSYHTFSLDKEADAQWDQAMLQFLSDNGIPYERIA